MTLNRWFVVLVSVAGLAGCDNPVAPPAVDRLNARWAGRDWVGSVSAVLINSGGSDTLYVFAEGSTNPDDLALTAATQIVAKVAFNGVGSYHLGPGAARFEEWLGGDVVTATYATNAETSGTLTITRYDGIGKDIEGTLSFDAVSVSPYKSYGDRASLEDGRFRTTVLVPSATIQ